MIILLLITYLTLHQNSTSIPEDRQRLIYRGRVLQDQSPLNEYKIEDGHTVHMVAKPADYEELQHRISEQEANVTAQQPSSQSAWQSLLALSALSGDPLMRTFPSGPEHFRRRNGTFDDSTTHESTSLEPIRQSLLTVHTLLSTMPNLSTQAPTRRGRLFFVGQWLDVKDTVNQWLEATVMEVDERLARLFVHYNGWYHDILYASSASSKYVTHYSTCQADEVGRVDPIRFSSNSSFPHSHYQLNSASELTHA